MSHAATATLRIANLGTQSAALSSYWNSHANSRAAEVALGHAKRVTILSPVAGTVEVRTVPGGTWGALRNANDAADVALVAAKAISFPAPGAVDLRVVASGAVGADTDISVSLQEEMD